MRKILFALLLISPLCLAQNGYIHGNGDPRIITPTPNCAASRFYIDDSTAIMYTASQGSPCVWSLGSGGAVSSVNSKTGAVVLSASDVGADPSGAAAAVAPSSPTVSGALWLFGDSTMAGVAGATSIDLSMAGILANDYPGASYNYAVGGTVMGQIASSILTYAPVGVTATTRIPTFVSNGGINDANNNGVNGLNNYNLAVNAAVSWALIPVADKVMASTCTASGTWAASTLIPINNTIIGTAMTSTTNGSTLTCTVPSSNNKVGVTWELPQATSGGTFTVSLDGTLQTNTCSGTTSWTEQGCSSVAVFNSIFRQEFTVTPGSHTIIITVTSTTSASNPVYFLDADTNPSSTAGQPYFVFTGVLKQYTDLLSTTTAAYDSALSADITALAADNLNVIFANVRTGTPGVNSTTDMANATNVESPCQGGSQNLHPNNCGYLHYAQTVENAAAAGFSTKLFYPLFGQSYSKFGNSRFQGSVSFSNSLVQNFITSPVTAGGTATGAGFWQINATNPNDPNQIAQGPGTGNFVPSICYYGDCSGNMAASGLMRDVSRSVYATALFSTFGMGFYHCPVNVTTGPTACYSQLFVDPNTDTVTARGAVQVGATTAATCSSSIAGEIQYTQGNSTTKDIVQVCAHDVSNVYAWRAIY